MKVTQEFYKSLIVISVLNAFYGFKTVISKGPIQTYCIFKSLLYWSPLILFHYDEIIYICNEEYPFALIILLYYASIMQISTVFHLINYFYCLKIVWKCWVWESVGVDSHEEILLVRGGINLESRFPQNFFLKRARRLCVVCRCFVVVFCKLSMNTELANAESTAPWVRFP